MTKTEIQKRITKNGVAIPLDDFCWDEKSKTISTSACGYVFDLENMIGCTVKTWNNCTIKTGRDCTIKTGSNCTIDAGRDCTIDTGLGCVVVRRDIFEVITLTNPVNHIYLCPRDTPGYVRDGIYSVTGKPAIIADGILSEIVSKKKSVYKVINYSESEISFLIEKDGVFSHGKTIKEAKESLMYKISDRDTSIYNNHDLNTVLTTEEAIKMYRVITGACEEGTKYFVSKLPNVPKKLTVSKLIKLTEGQYNHKSLVDFFKDKAGEVSDEN